MSLKIMTLAFDAQNLSPSQKLVLLALADHANDHGVCWPGIKHIVHKTCLSSRSVQRAINDLIDKKLIISEAQFNAEGRQRSNLYCLNFEGVTVSPSPPLPCHSVTLEGVTVSPGRVSDCHPNHNIEPSKESNIRKTDSKTGSVEIIFDFYKLTLNHPTAKLSDKRKRLIKNALKLYKVEELKNAITGCSKSKWNMGGNPDGKTIDAIELILRDSGKIEQFMNYTCSQKKNTTRLGICGNCKMETSSQTGPRNLCNHCHTQEEEIRDAKFSRSSPVSSVMQHLVK